MIEPCFRLASAYSGPLCPDRAHLSEIGGPVDPGWHHGAMAVAHQAGLTLAGLRKISAELTDAAARRGATNLRVFGSVARGEATPTSDLDLLVDLEPGRSLVDLGGLLMDLSEIVGVEVDVVTEAGLKPRVRDRVLAEAVPL